MTTIARLRSVTFTCMLVAGLAATGTAARSQRHASSTLPPCVDDDGDAYADCSVDCEPGVLACGDCDDTDASRHPGTAESCNHIDDSCDGQVDEGFPAVWADGKVVAPSGPARVFLGAAVTGVGDI